ncbi:MAG: hypothetical protein JNM70_03945 [Anaerolineae bacterium]|nr:hypothetical protein [Anaerolineae bacterium]
MAVGGISFGRTVTANPILWQECLYQARSIPALMRRYWPLGMLLIGLILGGVALTLRDIASPTRELALFTIWIVHALTAARCVAAGANAISREHVGQTWDTLILTGVSARHILLGKWEGVLRVSAPWILLLGTVRLVMIPIFTLALVNRFAWRAGNSVTSYPGYGAPTGVEWVPWAALLAVVMTVVLTILEVFACTAVGLAASALVRRGWLAMIAAMIVRFMPVALFAAFTRYEVGAAPSWRVLRFPYLGLADSGTAPLYQLSLPLTGWTQDAHAGALPGLLMVMLLLATLTIGGLLVAWWAIRRDGALPHQPRPAAT